MRDPADLILCSATLEPDPMKAGPDCLAQQLQAASEAGFAGISMWTMYYAASLQAGHDRASLLETVRESGLRIPIVEAILPWDEPDDSSAIKAADETFALAEAFGATQAVVVTMAPGALDLNFASRRFHQVCEVAADHGVRPMIEFLPWSGIPDLATAWQIVQAADQPNGAIMIDTWHWRRQPGGPAPDLLRTIPGHRIPVVQLCDSAPGIEGGTQSEAMTDRRLPGEGNVDFAELFGVLDEIGADPIIAPEVFNLELTHQGMTSMAKTIFEASVSVLRMVDN
jgi:sugar phosphate isomerase/epimerase